MKRMVTFASLILLMLTLGCSGSSSPVLRDLALQPTPTLETLSNSVVPESVTAAFEGEGQPSRKWGQRGQVRGTRGERGEKFQQLLDSGCATKSGDPQTGGSLTFDNCDVRGGNLTGTVTWAGDADASEDGFATSTTKQLTYVKTGDEASLPELGHARMWAKSLGISLVPERWDTAIVTSAMSMSGTKGDRESFTRTGTTDIVFTDGGAPVRTINIVMNAPISATITVDGQAHEIDLRQMREQFRQRMGEGREKHGKRRDGKVRLDAQESATPAAELTSNG